MKHLKITLYFGFLLILILLSLDTLFAINQQNQATIRQANTIKNTNTVSPIIKSAYDQTNGTFIDNNKETKELKYIISKNKRIISDSLEIQNKLDIWENSFGEIIIRLKLKEKDQRIKITIWNMLGKAVVEDFEGNYKDLNSEHTIKNSNSLNRGAYLIRVQGEKSKIDAKFIKSR